MRCDVVRGRLSAWLAGPGLRKVKPGVLAARDQFRRVYVGYDGVGHMLTIIMTGLWGDQGCNIAAAASPLVLLELSRCAVAQRSAAGEW